MAKKTAHFSTGFSFEEEGKKDSSTLTKQKNHFIDPTTIDNIDKKEKKIDELEVKIQHKRLNLQLPKVKKQEKSLPKQKKNESKDENYFETEETEAVIDFASMNLSKTMLKSINAMGYTSPTPIQQKAIPVALLGRDICGGAETGSGKTAAFLIPIIERLFHKGKKDLAIRVLIILPTRELAVQCYEVAIKLLTFCSFASCTLIAGGLPIRPQEAELKKRPDIVIATPGRLIDHLRNCSSFDLDSIEILVLDEADRMLEEGFADELNEIVRACPKQRQTMLFSASMTENVDDLIRLSLTKPIKIFVDETTKIARNLLQEFVRIRGDQEGEEDNHHRWSIVLYLCRLAQRAIIFFPTKELVHQGRILLGLCGLKVSELHGNLTQTQRLEALDHFKNAKTTHLVATDVAARGLDIPSVEMVIMYSMPANYSQYQHRVGRTARAGQSGRSISLVGEGADRKMLKEVIKNSTVTPKHRLIAHDTLLEYRELFKQLQPKLKEILEEEKVDNMVFKAEKELKKATNLSENQETIKSRPKKEWFQSKFQKQQSRRKEKTQSSEPLRIKKKNQQSGK